MLTIRARGYAVRVPKSRNDGSLSREERHRLALLGLPTFGLALAITVVSTYYSASRGLGVMLGPLLGGVAISVGSGAFGSTEGYAAMWGVCGAAALASVPLILRVRREPARS
jgi:hypothetical protein